MTNIESQPSIIWDMDGVIINSEPQHCRAWVETFNNHGVRLTEQQCKEFSGRRDDDTIRHFMGNEISKDALSKISNEKQSTFRKIAISEHITALPGVVSLITYLHDRHIKQAIASSAPRENINLILSALNLGSFFGTIIGSADVNHGKPDPEVFLVAAKRLGVQPTRCVVFEDAIAGVTAGKAAGMKVIAVTTTNLHENLTQADLVVDSLEEISFDIILKLMGSSNCR